MLKTTENFQIGSLYYYKPNKYISFFLNENKEYFSFTKDQDNILFFLKKKIIYPKIPSKYVWEKHYYFFLHKEYIIFTKLYKINEKAVIYNIKMNNPTPVEHIQNSIYLENLNALKHLFTKIPS